MNHQLKLVAPDDPVLFRPAPTFDGDPRTLRPLAVGMWEIMRANRIENYSDDARAAIKTAALLDNGIGLAAPQVGQSVRLIVIDLHPNRFAGARACVNPVVVRTMSAPRPYPEGCLTRPGLRRSVERSEQISVQYTTLLGKVVKEQMHGMLARAFQHELDHLDGRCIFGP